MSAVGQVWVKPPGASAGAFYWPDEMEAMRAMVAGPDYLAFLDTGVVSDELRGDFAAAMLAHELKAQCEATLEPDSDVAATETASPAILRIDTAADPGWAERAVAAVLTVAKRQDELTAEDVWAVTGEAPEDLREMGHVMLEAQRRCWIQASNRTVDTADGGQMRVWRSTARRS